MPDFLRILNRASIWLLLFVVCFCGYAQPVDEALYHQFSDWFDARVGVENNGLYQGPIYLMILPSRTTHQFFGTKVWGNGNIRVDQNQYFDIPMVFDIEHEQIILKHPDPTRRDGIAPEMTGVSSFELNGHFFKRLPSKESYGFFDILYPGANVSLVAKRKKVRKTQSHGVEMIKGDAYFLYYEADLIPLKNKGTLTIVSPNSKRIIRGIKKKYQARFKKHDEPALIEFIKYFDAEIH